jgi:alkylhydroperoxidase family enzyme
MARLPYVDAWTAAGDATLAQLFEAIGASRGAVLHLYAALANQPRALAAFMEMSWYVRDRSALRADLRELAILLTAEVLDADYERAHHRIAARRAGVSERKLAALPGWRASSAFDAGERAVLDYAEQVARRRLVDDETFAELRRHLSDPEIVDLALVAGWYQLCAAILGPLAIELEPWLEAESGPD